MRSEKNTSKSFRSLATWAIVLSSFLFSACASGPVVEVEPCFEIPFVDGAEAACTNTVTHKPYLVNAADWQREKKKGVIILRARDWSKIRKAWGEACIMVGDECNVYMRTVDRAVRDLDAIAGKYIKKP